MRFAKSLWICSLPQHVSLVAKTAIFQTFVGPILPLMPAFLQIEEHALVTPPEVTTFSPVHAVKTLQVELMSDLMTEEKLSTKLRAIH